MNTRFSDDKEIEANLENFSSLPFASILLIPWLQSIFAEYRALSFFRKFSDSGFRSAARLSPDGTGQHDRDA